MAGNRYSGNFTERRGRKLRRIIRLDDDSARLLRDLWNQTMLSEDQIVALLIRQAADENEIEAGKEKET